MRHRHALIARQAVTLIRQRVASAINAKLAPRVSRERTDGRKGTPLPLDTLLSTGAAFLLNFLFVSELYALPPSFPQHLVPFREILSHRRPHL